MIKKLLPLVLLLVLASCGDDEDESAEVELPQQPRPNIGFKPEAPPPPPPPPPIVVQQKPVVPPPPPPPIDYEAIRRQQELERAQALRQAANRGLQTATNAPRLEYKTQDNDYSRLGLPRDNSTLPVKRDYVITADRYISAVLENSINSQLPGRLIAVVERSVYGSDGKVELLPKGTRLICQYKSLADVGDSRLEAGCSRAILPNGASLLLTGAAIADQSGRTGLVGTLDRRIWERYGDAFIVSIISSLSALGGTGASEGTPLNTAANNLSTNLGEVTAKILDETIGLEPIMTIPAGTRIQIIPSTDIWIRQPEWVEVK
jgi:type IV secretion system protein VirB10